MGVLPVCLCSRSVSGAHRGWKGASAFMWVPRTEPGFSGRTASALLRHLSSPPLFNFGCFTLEVCFAIFVRGCKQPFPHLLGTCSSLDKTTSVNK